jgi:hypothetical protein
MSVSKTRWISNHRGAKGLTCLDDDYYDGAAAKRLLPATSVTRSPAVGQPQAGRISRVVKST